MRNAATAKAMSTNEIAHPSITCLAVDMGAYGSLYSYLYVGGLEFTAAARRADRLSDCSGNWSCEGRRGVPPGIAFTGPSCQVDHGSAARQRSSVRVNPLSP